MSKAGYLLSVTLFLLFSHTGQLFSQDVGQYDENISRLVGKLRQYPSRVKLMEELKQNFQLASEADLKEILELKSTGQPDIWYPIFQANERIKNRQDLVMTLPEKTIRESGITFADNSRDLEESRSRAALYSYAVAEKMMAGNDPYSARIAYVELLKVIRTKGGQYRDLDRLLRKAILVGSTSMEFELYNRSGKKLTADIIGRLNRIVGEYKKARYAQQGEGEKVVSFRFTLRVIITEINVGPDQIKELAYGEERDLYRDSGLVDTIRCQVQEYRQLKKAMVAGRIEFFDNQIAQVVNVVPLQVESVFTNAYGTLQGNPDAAGDETRRLIASREAEYPPAEQMILDATDEFVKKSTEIILAE